MVLLLTSRNTMRQNRRFWKNLISEIARKIHEILRFEKVATGVFISIKGFNSFLRSDFGYR